MHETPSSSRRRSADFAAVAALALGAVIAFTPAFAQTAPVQSKDQILQALKPKAKTRSLSKPAKADPARAALIADLTQKAKTRGLSAPERNQLAEIVVDSPKVDLEVYFEFNSSQITEASKAQLTSLGLALQDQQMKGASVMVAGHTDAKGKASYNQRLSEQRAAAVKAFLVDGFNLNKDNLTAVGYGPERLKDPNAPFSDVNRRVQVVNLTTDVGSVQK